MDPKPVSEFESEIIIIEEKKGSPEEIKNYFLHLLTILNNILYFPEDKLNKQDTSPAAVFLQAFAESSKFKNNCPKILSEAKNIIDELISANELTNEKLLNSIHSMLSLFIQESNHIVACGNKYTFPFAVKQYKEVIDSFKEELDLLYYYVKNKVSPQIPLSDSELRGKIIKSLNTTINDAEESLLKSFQKDKLSGVCDLITSLKQLTSSNRDTTKNELSELVRLHKTCLSVLTEDYPTTRVLSGYTEQASNYESEPIYRNVIPETYTAGNTVLGIIKKGLDDALVLIETNLTIKENNKKEPNWECGVYPHPSVKIKKPAAVEKEVADRAFAKLRNEMAMYIIKEIKPMFEDLKDRIPAPNYKPFQEILTDIYDLVDIENLKDLNKQLNFLKHKFFSETVPTAKIADLRFKDFKLKMLSFFTSFIQKVENSHGFKRELFQPLITEQLQIFMKNFKAIKDEKSKNEESENLKTRCLDFQATVHKEILPLFYDQDKCFKFKREEISPLLAHQHLNQLLENYLLEEAHSGEIVLNILLAFVAELTGYYPAAQALILPKIEKIFDETNKSVNNIISLQQVEEDIVAIEIINSSNLGTFTPPSPQERVPDQTLNIFSRST